jgi:hypothetical protein
LVAGGAVVVETVDKNGRVKFTFEMEINQSAMELIRQNVGMMSELVGQAAENWREEMARRRKDGKMQGGHGMGMMMHHGQE